MRFAFMLFLLVATPAYAVDPTGIPQCDDLLKRYEGCSVLLPREKVHEAQKELLQGAIGIRSNADNPATRPQLEAYCADTLKRMQNESDIKECMSK